MLVKFRPRVIKANTKNEIISEIHRMAGLKCSRKFPQTNSDNTMYFVYNLEKHNKKTKVNKKKKKLVTEKGSTHQRDVIKKAHWVAYVYFIPKYLVMEYKQHDRNFKITFFKQFSP
jgi:hypothetical protein